MATRSSGNVLVFKALPKLRPERVWRMIDAFTDTAVVRVDPETGMSLQCISKAQNAMLEWKKNLEHRDAQRMGRQKWYESFRVRIARVEREYGK